MVFTVDPLAPDWTISWRLLSGKEVWSPTGMHTCKHTNKAVKQCCREATNPLKLLSEALQKHLLLPRFK